MVVMNKHDSALIDKLVQLADGDIELVQRAIRDATPRGGREADLNKIIDNIQNGLLHANAA